MGGRETKVTVIIPSLDGCRGGNVEKLERELESQTLKPSEVIVVKGVSPNGKARNAGVERAAKDADFFIFIDDDVLLGGDRVIESLVAPFLSTPSDDGKAVGMTGLSQLIPEDSSWWQRVAAKQVPRNFFPVQSEMIDSDMVSHMCLCMPAKLFRGLGMENPDIVSGTDPDLRHRVRRAGYRVCVVPQCWAYHPMPETFAKFAKMAFNKGKNSAIVRKTHPEMILELDWGDKKEFKAHRGLLYRVLRLCFLMGLSLVTFQFFLFIYLVVGALGNVWGSFQAADRKG
ncbi:MAG: glycosyltransferase [Victivallales bacterium]|nr:glycosyltransferase [Victivallales bacterium]